EFHANGVQLVGKLLDTVDGQVTFRRLEAIQARGTQTLRVPRPVTWCDGPRVLVTEAARGVRATELHPASWGPEMTRFGRALRELHGLALDWGPAKRLVDHVQDLVRPDSSTLASALP